MDHLVHDFTEAESEENTDVSVEERVSSLADFQKQVLLHAFSFPRVKKVVYSTCSKHAEENEKVVDFVLQQNSNFRLVQEVFPQWTRRGLPIINDHASVIRTLPSEDKTIGEIPVNQKNEPLYSIWVGDASGSIIASAWGSQYQDLEPGDMLKLIDVSTSMFKNRMQISLDRGKLVRYGTDELLFSFNPNMSHIRWDQSAGPKSHLWVRQCLLTAKEPLGEEPYSDW
ncbi:hypothetical protein HDU91_004093, partial [Kappamyces sp. JEL0680]